MTLTKTDLQNLVERYGWTHKELPDGTVITGFHGFYENFLVSYEVQENWLTIITPNYLPSIPEQKAVAICQQVAELNNIYPYIRLIIKKTEVAIVADIPIKNQRVNFDLYKIAMDLICEAADRFYPLLYEQITDEKLPPPSEDEA